MLAGRSRALPFGAIIGAAALGMSVMLAGCANGGPLADRKEAATHSTAPTPVEVIEAFDKMVLEGRGTEAILKYVSEDFIEHNQTVRGGNRDGLLERRARRNKENDAFPDRVHVVDRRIASGEYVVTQHHYITHKEDRGTVIIDIFRVVDGKIVEHWDVTEKVPESDTRNPHTMW